MAVPTLKFPAPSRAKYVIKDSYNRVYIPGTTKKYARGRHAAIDISGPRGTSLAAVISGTVKLIDWGPAYGKQFLIVSGGAGAFYAHCDKILVKNGQKVKAGQLVAKMGASGNTSGPHLHFEWHPSWGSWSKTENPYVQLEKARKRLL